ncbi:MAG: hypothetical protein LBL55_01140, partial [Propionibacteriaceae bacterium]|nr:hypothetical protein [Propionibacteriaceae bacterium]
MQRNQKSLRYLLCFGIALLFGAFALPAAGVPPVASSTPMTAKATRSASWNSVVGSGTIQGYKNAILSAQTAKGVWTNSAQFTLKLSRTDTRVNGSYGKLTATTSYLAYVQRPAAYLQPVVSPISSSKETGRTNRSALVTATASTT